MTEQEYQEAADSNLGFCTKCKTFTTDSCEPDARRYKCDECGCKTVFGAEEALIEGLIDFT